MPLNVGEIAPDFSLKDTEGNEISLSSVGGLRLLTFYKVTCPTCQLTLPFIEKLHKAYGNSVRFLGIVQDPPEEAVKFARNYGLTFTQLVDAPEYAVSSQYRVEVVPTIYLLNEEGKIIFVGESFLKAGIEKLSSEIARLTDSEEVDVFEGADVPAFKPG